MSPYFMAELFTIYFVRLPFVYLLLSILAVC
jgi:hypothetical protein